MNKNQKIMIISILSLYLVGCSSLPGGVSQNQSMFDGSNEIVVAPGFVRDGPGLFAGSPFRLGGIFLNKNPEEVQLLVVIPELLNIRRNKRKKILLMKEIS